MVSVGVSPSKRHVSGDHLVEHSAQTPYIRACIDVGSFRLFRRHVTCGAYHSAGAGVDHCFSRRLGVGNRNRRAGQLGEAKIEQLDVAVAPDHDVLGLDVAMDDAGFMSCDEGAGGLDGNVQNLIEKQRAVADALAESVAVDKFSRDETRCRRLCQSHELSGYVDGLKPKPLLLPE